MASLTIVAVFFYSPIVGVVTLCSIAAYGVYRLYSFSIVHAKSERSIIEKARESTRFLETIRGITAIKMYSEEAARQEVWQNQFAKVIDADHDVGVSKAHVETFNILFLSLDNILSTAYLCWAAIEKNLTIGMVFAVLAYKKMLSDKVIALIDRFVDFKMLDLYLQRISDIALAETELGNVDRVELAFEGATIRLCDVNFRYGDGEPWILEGLNFEIRGGESVAITGPSGSGKTTFAKVLVGLSEGRLAEVVDRDLAIT